MRKKCLVLNLFAVAILASACRPSAPISPMPQATPSTDGSWTLSLEQSGGIAGVQLSVQVTSARELTATDGRSGRVVKQSLPPQTLDELRRLIGGANLAQVTQSPSVCADCFIYVLKYTSQTQTYRVQADDVTLPDSGAQALIAYLLALRDAALAPKP